MNPYNTNFCEAIYKIIRVTLQNESFQFKAPREFTRTFKCRELSQKHLRSMQKTHMICKEILKDTKVIRMNGLSVRDEAKTSVDVFPIPLPEIQIVRNTDMLRYRGTLLIFHEGVILSLVLIQPEDKESPGMNISNREASLLASIRAILQPALQGRCIRFDYTIDLKENIRENTEIFLGNQSEEALMEAIKRLPDPVLFAVIHAVLATVMPLLKEHAKPFYFPSIRISSDKEKAQEQCDNLRSWLGAFSFGCVSTDCAIYALELDIQTLDDLKTLRMITGIPVLVRVRKVKILNQMITEMQQTHCSLAAAGQARHPYQTLPLLVSDQLPSDHVALVLDWCACDMPLPKDIQTLQRGVGRMLTNVSRLVKTLDQKMHRLALYGISYPDIYFLSAVRAISQCLFRNKENQDAMVKWAKEQRLIIENQQMEQINRIELAVKLLCDIEQYKDLIADSNNNIGPDHLGFWYEYKGTPCLAFAVKEDFPEFCKRRLQLTDSDITAFRKQLKDIGITQSAGTKVRGRASKPTQHVLILKEKLRSPSEIPGNS